MNLANFNINMQQVIEVTNKDTGEVTFLVYHDNEWNSVTKEEYQKIIEGVD